MMCVMTYELTSGSQGVVSEEQEEDSEHNKDSVCKMK